MKKLIAALALIALCQTAHAQVPGLVGPNQVLAGPTSGGTSQPAVSRALITQDLPNPLTLQQIINLNAVALPTPTTGTLLEAGNADTVNSLYESSAFGATNKFNGRRANGTNASPTTLVTTNIINALTGSGYDGTGWSAPAAAFNLLAEGTWSNTSHPSEACVQTTPTSSLTIATGLCQHQDKGVTLGAPTGGDEGANTINSAGAIYVNGVQVAAFPVATRAGDVIYWSGSAWTNFGGNTSGTQCYGENAVGAPQWTACSGGGGSSPGGSNGQIQYNASSSFGGASGLTTDGTHLTITVSGGTSANLTLDTPTTSEISNVNFRSNGTTKWQLGKDSTGPDQFYLYDFAASRYDVTVQSNGNMALMPSAGVATIGNSVYADNSGHPYCDVRNFGAGTGSNSADQTAIANALSACSAGYVFFPCGAYGNTAPWTVPAFTTVRGAARACVSITTTQTNGDVFVCGSGGTNGPKPIEMSEMQIYGSGALTSGTVPTAGYAIDCQLGGNQQTFYDLYVNGTFNGIYIGGAGGRIRDSRLETLYGPGMIYAPIGGNLIDGNQLDNNSEFNATGGPGFGTYLVYNTGSPVVVATGAIALSNNYLFVATVGGTTGPSGSGITVSPIYKNITDGTVTWQMVGNQTLTLVTTGTESWVTDNDMTSPANIGIGLFSSLTGNKNWIRGNNFAGEVVAGVYLSGGVSYNHIVDNQFQEVGYKVTTTSTGFPIFDAGGGDNSFTTIIGNTFSNTPDTAMFVTSDYWNISSNSIGHNQKTSQYCGINISTSGSSPIGTNITGNNIFNQGTDAICTTGGGGSNTVVVGNAVFGGTIFLSGTNIQSGNL